jgi:hypothetical protein
MRTRVAIVYMTKASPFAGPMVRCAHRCHLANQAFGALDALDGHSLTSKVTRKVRARFAAVLGFDFLIRTWCPRAPDPEGLRGAFC